MKIIIGGSLNKDKIAALVTQYIPSATVEIKSDLDAAMMIKNGLGDYYLGSCDTGAGGSLGMAIALLGMDKCITLAMPGKILEENEIEQALLDQKIAFGFTPQSSEYVISTLAKYIK